MHYYFIPIEKYSNELVVEHNGMTRLFTRGVFP